eukprot:scaffold174637_cov31-Tisochrysis_lutea.AAC.1
MAPRRCWYGLVASERGGSRKYGNGGGRRAPPLAPRLAAVCGGQHAARDPKLVRRLRLPAERPSDALLLKGEQAAVEAVLAERVGGRGLPAWRDLLVETGHVARRRGWAARAARALGGGLVHPSRPRRDPWGIPRHRGEGGD